jgi:hypothetical protein
MSDMGITPVVTHRVRAFLAAQGVDLRPWSGLDETYACLYGLLRERRDDEPFWTGLGALVSRLAADGKASARLHAAPGSELLTALEQEVLIRDLRAALPADGSASATASLRAFTRALPGPVLAGFLLLGLAAAGCVDNKGNDESGGLKCTLPPSGILYQTIAESSLDSRDRLVLCLCMETLTADWKTGLTELFQTGTPDEIAAALTALVNCCEEGPLTFNDPYRQQVQDLLIEGMLCGVPLYKGVSFPPR